LGGGTEGNETPEETLLREIKEELDFIPEKYVYFNKYDLPQIILNLFVINVGDDFEKQIKILEGEYGRWFSKEDFLREKSIITGDLTILEELYEKLPEYDN